MTDVQPQEIADFRHDHPELNDIPDTRVRETAIFQWWLLGHRLGRLYSEAKTTLPPWLRNYVP